MSVASCFCRPSVPTTGVNLQPDSLQLLLNSFDIDDKILPHIEVKVTGGNTFIATDLIAKLMKYFLTRLCRSQKPSAVV